MSTANRGRGDAASGLPAIAPSAAPNGVHADRRRSDDRRCAGDPGLSDWHLLAASGLGPQPRRRSDCHPGRHHQHDRRALDPAATRAPRGRGDRRREDRPSAHRHLRHLRRPWAQDPDLHPVYDSAGGPKNIIAGTAPKGSRDIVIDRSLARIHGLRLGERIEISEYAFRISGITSDNVAFFAPFAFVTYDGMIDFYMESKVVGDITTFPLLSFLIVELKPGADRSKVAAAIEARVPEADVFVPRTLAANDQKLGRAMLGPVFNLITAVSFVIGVLVIGLIMFAAVNARRRSLGVLKALGFSTRRLSGSVLFEAALITALAFPFGIALAWAVAAVVDWAAPLYVVMFDDPVTLLRTALGCAAFAVAGSLIPVRLIARLEPAIVFRR
ncbi:MAG: ABC transporter permease [Alphaproteobacteria bacterium]|nr:ABC transporter permease [Alphaproteobacteria bacterium]